MSMNYTFSTTAALGASGTYDIVTYTMLTADADSTNDTLGTSVNSFASVSTFPYSTSFETSNDSWFATGDASWELGAPAGFVIDTASDGTQAWVRLRWLLWRRNRCILDGSLYGLHKFSKSCY